MDYSIFDQMEFVVYVSDIDSQELIYMNAFARQLFGIQDTASCYGKCHEVLQSTDEICEFCNNEQLREKGSHTWNRHHPISGNYYIIKDYLIMEGSRKLRLECAIDVSEIETNRLQTHSQLVAEQNIIACIQALGTYQSLEESISQVLQVILGYYKGTRAYIFEFDWKKETMSNTFERCTDGVTAEIDNLQDLPRDVAQFWIECFRKHTYVQIENIEDLQKDSSRQKEYETLKAQNIRSLIAVPFYCDEVFGGFLGVDDPSLNKEDVKFLSSLTYFIIKEVEKRRLNERLTQLSYWDQLTKVRNRNSYYERLHELEGKMLQQVGVLFIDMNGLKILNDTYGHLHGDQAIQAVATWIRKYFEAHEVFRVSGDEFIILVTDYEYEDFINKVYTLQEELIVSQEEMASIGYLWEKQVLDLKQMISRAEQMMYVNKQRFYERHSMLQTKYRPRILDELLKEIEKANFTIYLQPKANLESGEVYGAEALVRRIGPDGRIVMPYEFISLLEKEGFIAKIDYFVLEEVCKCLKQWREEGRRALQVSVNISRVTLSEAGLMERICKICDRYDIPYNQIELEITESAEIMDSNQLQALILQLSAYGFKVALDDMGTQYSSLEMLTMKGINTIKLDRSLICDIESKHNALTLLRYIIALCHDLGQNCVAEGVENEVQKEILRELSCDCIQGYWLDKPIPVRDFEERYM